MSRRAAAVPADGTRPRLYYGWVLVGTLALTETVSYGVLQYAFPVFLAPMRAELGWSRAALTGAYSLAALVAGLAAIPAGRWVDRHGPRGLMTGGSALAAALLLAWSRVRSLAAFYALWTGLGLAMAAVLYEPAFVVVACWFRRRQGRALTVLTFVAGFASVIFVPLATHLVAAHGWRGALARLAGIVAALTIVPHALLLRRRPADLGLRADGADADASASPDADAVALSGISADEAVRGRAFRWLAAGFALASLANSALVVHLLPLLMERGYPAAFAGAAVGAVGLMALPGRLVFTPLGGRWPRAAVTASIFVLQALGIAALLAGHGSAAVWACVALFGAGFGAITPARAALLAEMYGAREYGRISGVLALFLAFARAAGPVGASLLYTAGGGYAAVLAALAAVSLAAAGAVLAAGSAPSLEAHQALAAT